VVCAGSAVAAAAEPATTRNQAGGADDAIVAPAAAFRSESFAIADTIAISESASTVPEISDRKWAFRLFFGLGGWDGYDVFGRDEVPDYTVAEPGSGLGFELARRLSDRFLLGLRAAALFQDTSPDDAVFSTIAFELTGTLELRPRTRWRPYLVGAFGGGGATIGFAPDTYWVVGSLASLGAGSRYFLGQGFSLEAALHGLAWNRRKGGRQTDDGDSDSSDDDWNLRGGTWGWRVEFGVGVWF
jgi:hypothetical protein